MQRTTRVPTDTFIDAILADNTELCIKLLDQVDPDVTIASLKIGGERLNSLTLIHIAAVKGNEELLTLLCKRKHTKLKSREYQQDIKDKMSEFMNKKDGKERNALHLAVKYAGSKEATIRTLHKLGCVIEHPDKDGKTPLEYAMERKDDESFFALCELHATINERCMKLPEDSLTPLAKSTIAFLKEANEYSQQPPALRKDMLFSINARDSQGLTALQHAIKGNNAGRVAELLKQDAKFTTGDIHSTSNQRIKYLLLEALHQLRSIEQTKMLFNAVENMNFTMAAKSLNTTTEDVRYSIHVTTINYKALINARNIDNKTPLHIALQKANIDKDARNYHNLLETAKKIISLLLENKANINARDSHGKTALNYAIATGNISIVNEILKYQPNIDTTCNNNRTILHEAIEAGNIEILKKILSSGGNIHINAQDNKGNTPLHLAAKNKSSDMIKELLKHQPDIYVKNNEQERFLELINLKTVSFTANTPELKKLDKLLKYKYTMDKYLTYKNKEGIELTLEGIIKFDIDEEIKTHVINLKDEEGKTALHYAAISNNKPLLEKLLLRNANPNIQDKEGRTALHYAEISGNVDMANHLIELGARDNIPDIYQKEPWAYIPSKLNVYDRFRHGVGFLTLDPKERSLLHLAVIDNNHKAVKELLTTNQYDPNQPDIYGRIPLHYAKDPKIFKLLTKDSSLEIQDRYGFTPKKLFVESHTSYQSIITRGTYQLQEGMTITL